MNFAKIQTQITASPDLPDKTLDMAADEVNSGSNRFGYVSLAEALNAAAAQWIADHGLQGILTVNEEAQE